MANKTNPEARLKLKGVRVIFYNPEDTGFGCSVTVDVTPEDIRKQVIDWVKENNIGKDTPGEAKIKEYTAEDGTVTYQYAFKINEYTQYAGLNGLSKDNIGYGAVIDLIAVAYVYNNKFTGGKDRVGQSASAIVVRSGASTSGEADLAELLGEAGEEADGEEKVSGIPF